MKFRKKLRGVIRIASIQLASTVPAIFAPTLGSSAGTPFATAVQRYRLSDFIRLDLAGNGISVGLLFLFHSNE
jgi:hypothetical protein